MEEILLMSQIETELSALITAGIVIIIGLIVKDILSAAAFGILFYFDRNFHEGDTVYVNGQLATIIRISLTKSIFKMHDSNRWKYVHNSRIRFLDLEKVIEPNKEK
jgi:small-conductance mechanosensitive channel